MRLGDEDEDEDFEEENEEDEDEGIDVRANGSGDSPGDVEEEDVDPDGVDNSDDEGTDEENGDDDGEEDEEDDDDDEDDEDDDDEDEEEDDDDDDEEDSEEEATKDGETHGDDEAGSTQTSERSRALSQHSQDETLSTTHQLAPHLLRRSLLMPSFTSLPKSLSIEAIVAIPLPSAIHSIALTTCSSYMLTGSQEGYIRCYDFWSSVNGGQIMTAQQRTIVGLGEGVAKAGVTRGWWANEVEGLRDGMMGKRLEPVYSMACEGDGLWALTGTQSGPINLYTLRHSPGHLVHSLKGHTSVVSCMTLLPGEKSLLSGSWDGTLREWDLNTGQTVRSYPTHGAQLSSIALRSFSPQLSPSPSSQVDMQVDMQEDGEANGHVSISTGRDFFEKREPLTPPVMEEAQAAELGATIPDDSAEQVAADLIERATPPDADVHLSDKPSPYDPLFDDDAEGEDIATTLSAPLPDSPIPSKKDAGSPPRSQPSATMLTHPAGQPSATPTASTALFASAQVASSSRPGAAETIPVLSPASYNNFSEDVLLTSSMDGQVVLIDRRVPVYAGSGGGVGRLLPAEKAPPWCMSACWSSDGQQVLAGRRNGTVDIWDVRRASSSSSPNVLRSLRTPSESGPVSFVVALPDTRHVATASQDNIRLWNTAENTEPDDSMRRSKSRPPFKIIAGHHGGIISSMVVDPTCRFLVTASGDRGWQGESTRVVLIHEIKV